MAASPANAEVTGPSRIFIVRHGDRVDHENRSWRMTTTRPHDSPLSERGHCSAHLLGRYLATHRNVKITSDTQIGDIVVLASPLQRTVETGHDIICGILKASDAMHLVPKQHPKCYDDASATADAVIAELAAQGIDFYTPAGLTAAHSLSSSSEVGLASLSINNNNAAPLTPLVNKGEFAGEEKAEVDLTQQQRLQNQLNQQGNPTRVRQKGDDLPFIPIYLEPGVIEGQYWLNGDIEDGVHMGNSTIKMTPAGTGTVMAIGGGVATAYAERKDAGEEDHGVYRGVAFHRDVVSPFVQAAALKCPLREGIVEGYNSGFGDVHFEFDKDTQQLVEHGVGVMQRCKATINSIASSPALNGKTVIIVGHGETTWEMVKGLLFFTSARRPYYTSFTEGVRMTDTELIEGKLQRRMIEIKSPEGAHLKPAQVPQEWHRWRVAEGTIACDAPHVTMARKSVKYTQ